MTDHTYACTLDAAGRRARQTQADALRSALRRRRREGRRVRLEFDPEAVEWVAEFVRDESACCAFFTFDLHAAPDDLRLDVTAPAGGEAMLDALWQSFDAEGV